MSKDKGKHAAVVRAARNKNALRARRRMENFVKRKREEIEEAREERVKKCEIFKKSNKTQRSPVRET